MDHNDLTGLYTTLGLSGGASLIIWTSVQAKIAHLRAKAQVRQQSKTPSPDKTLMADFQALKQQVIEIGRTSQEFDLSFDEALSRLEGRVARVETRSAIGVVALPTEAIRRNGSPSIA